MNNNKELKGCEFLVALVFGLFVMFCLVKCGISIKENRVDKQKQIKEYHDKGYGRQGR